MPFALASSKPFSTVRGVIPLIIKFHLAILFEQTGVHQFRNSPRSRSIAKRSNSSMLTSPGGGSRYMLMRCEIDPSASTAGMPRPLVPLAWTASQAIAGWRLA